MSENRAPYRVEPILFPPVPLALRDQIKAVRRQIDALAVPAWHEVDPLTVAWESRGGRLVGVWERNRTAPTA